MYTENDLEIVRQQQKKRWLLLTIPTVILLGAMVYSLFIRLEWLTTLATILLGSTLIFFYDLTIKPLRRYEVHLNNALHGRTREVDGTFSELSADISVVDGVKYRAMTLLVETDAPDPEERLLYFDLNKPFPDIAKGTRLHVVYHDREIVSLSLAQ